MTTAFIKIKSSDRDYFNIWRASDGSPEVIQESLDRFLQGVYESEEILNGRLNWQYSASNFMRYLSEEYTHKNSFNANRVCVAPDEWEIYSTHSYVLEPIKEIYEDLESDIRTAVKLTVKEK